MSIIGTVNISIIALSIKNSRWRSEDAGDYISSWNGKTFNGTDQGQYKVYGIGEWSDFN